MKNFSSTLLEEAMKHRALNHPYLLALEAGTFSNPVLALKDFTAQYLGYTSWFPKYLTAAISKLDNQTHRLHLIENLTEESGFLAEEELTILNQMGIETEWVQGIPHPELFKRFQKAMDINHEKVNYCDEVIIWRELFLNSIQSASQEEAVGAMGLGTEAIVKYIYRQFINAIKKHTDLTLEEYVFFELHTEVDDEHGKVLIEIAEEMATSEQARHDLRKGMLKALNLRCMFWDALHQRALNLPNSIETPQTLAQ